MCFYTDFDCFDVDRFLCGAMIYSPSRNFVSVFESVGYFFSSKTWLGITTSTHANCKCFDSRFKFDLLIFDSPIT